MIVTKFLSRVGALLGLGLIAALAFLFVLQPLSAWRNAQLTGVETVKSETVRLTASFDRLTVEREALSKTDGRSLSWSAATESAVAAEVQTMLAEAAANSGISFRSVTPLPRSRSSEKDRIVFRLEFESDLSQLTQFLNRIEYATPVLPITRATIRRLVRPGDQSEQPVVFAQLDVSAPILLEDGS